MMLWLHFRFWVFCSSLWNFNSAFWYPLFFKAVSYSDFVSLKISSLDELIVLTYNKGSLGFLYGQYVPFARLKVTSKKITIFRSWVYIVEHSNCVYKNGKNELKLLAKKHSNTNKVILPVKAKKRIPTKLTVMILMKVEKRPLVLNQNNTQHRLTNCKVVKKIYLI